MLNDLIAAATTPQQFDASPYLISFFSLAVGGIITVLVTRYNKKRESNENKEPTVNEAWKQQDADRQARFAIENLFRSLLWWYFDLREAFKAYYERVSEGGSTDLTAEEKTIVNREPPHLGDDSTGTVK